MVTVLELAIHRGAKVAEDGSVSGAEINRVGLPVLGGCISCGATVAAYNACPSRSGYLKCSEDCIGGDGWETVEEANAELFTKS